MSLIKQFVHQNKVALLMSALWSFHILLFSLNSFFNHAGFYKSKIDSILCAGTLLVLILLAIPSIFKTLSVKNWMFAFLFQLLFIATLALHASQSDLYLSYWPVTSFLIFPYYFLGAALKDFESVEQILLKVSKWVIVISSIYLFLKQFEDLGRMHDMSGAYAILPTSLLLIYAAFRYGGIQNWFWALFGIFTIVFAGTRGPIVSLFGFIGLSVLIFSLNKKNRKKSNFKVWGVMIVIIILLAKQITELLGSLYIFSVKNNIGNAALARFFEDDFLAGNGRESIGQTALSIIDKSPITGYGIFGDRLLIGTYPHQFFLELFINFGVILGSILILLLFYKIYKTLKKVKEDVFRYCFIWMVIFLSLVKLLMSNSYLEEPFFFLLLGLLSNKYIDKDIPRDQNIEIHSTTQPIL